jgi:hypothetical protein
VACSPCDATAAALIRRLGTNPNPKPLAHCSAYLDPLPIAEAFYWVGRGNPIYNLPGVLERFNAADSAVYTLSLQSASVPASAFWSLTMYGANSQQLVPNSVRRWAVRGGIEPDHVWRQQPAAGAQQR